MIAQASFALRGRNPDILTCIANLSNDEVFTPPEFANRMLDTLEESWASSHGGASIWEDPSVTFLDPCTKSGVFLREITSRLTDGLAGKIPDLHKRVDHILTKQVFGIAITRLTALLARRSLYCSKVANGTHSVARSFADEAGNVAFPRVEHTWDGERCRYCGAGKSVFDRPEGLETHAYAFIHTDDVRATVGELFGGKMQFDVIIGNPPYQMSTGGTGGAGVQARPIYNAFIEQAKKLSPRYLCMITPSRWFSGGMGLEAFRQSMLRDQRLRILNDYPDSNEVFPGTQIKGGVSYFLWERDFPGDVSVTTFDKDNILSTAKRPLLEPGSDIFIRYNEGVSILRKILSTEYGNFSKYPSLSIEKQFMGLVSSIGAFGLDTTFRGREKIHQNDILIYRNGGTGYISRSELTKETAAIDWWKVFIPAAGSGSDSFPHSILGKPFIGPPGTASSWTYMHIGPFADRIQAVNAISYISTKLFRFLVLLRKPTQHATRSVYGFVPLQDFSKAWNDLILAEKYQLADDERAFIDSMIRPMADDDD